MLRQNESFEWIIRMLDLLNANLKNFSRLSQLTLKTILENPIKNNSIIYYNTYNLNL